MKKSLAIFVVLAALFLSSCKLPVYTMGMTETEFKAQNRRADVVEATTNTTIYQILIQIDDKNKKHFMYYYFEGGRLVRVDEGQQFHHDNIFFVPQRG